LSISIIPPVGNNGRLRWFFCAAEKEGRFSSPSKRYISIIPPGSHYRVPSALTTHYIYYTPWIATFSAPVSIIPPGYKPLIRYIYYTTGLPLRSSERLNDA